MTVISRLTEYECWWLVPTMLMPCVVRAVTIHQTTKVCALVSSIGYVTMMHWKWYTEYTAALNHRHVWFELTWHHIVCRTWCDHETSDSHPNQSDAHLETIDEILFSCPSHGINSQTSKLLPLYLTETEKSFISVQNILRADYQIGVIV